MASFVASTPLVSLPSGASGRDSGLRSTAEGSTQTTTLPLLPPETPRASPGCVSFIKRSTRSFGFSSAVARQLAHCRRASTRINHQAKWSVYRSWCRRHGHSISRLSIPKIASFLLFLRCSLSLSYSSIASYRSMLSDVFRFVLPELSSHFFLFDLLRSFRLECPLSSSRVPPWDLAKVLVFLWGPPFEPLASCSLLDLTRKVLFLVSLAMVCRVSELQSVSFEVSSSGDDLFPSYLLEFRAKSESAARPLPCSISVCSLRDFVGDLPDELLLCPVHAFRLYLSRTASIPSRPRTLFVSLRSPSRPLSKNTLSFFIRDVISDAYTSLGTPLPSVSCSSSSFTSSLPSGSSSHSASALWAHGVHGVALSLGFCWNAPLTSVLEAATWASASVFTSFYLTDVQFSSSRGFSLGQVVAAGSVV